MKKSLKLKFIFGLLLLAVVLIIVLGRLTSSLVKNAMMEQYSYSGGALTQSIADRLDGDKINFYTKNYHEDDYYKYTRDYLVDLKKNFDLQYLYIYVPGENEFTYIWDASYMDYDNKILGYKEKYSTGGKKMTEDILENGATGKLYEISSSQYGQSVSSACPIYDSKDRVAGIVVADLSTKKLELTNRVITIFITGIIAFIMIVSIIIYYLFIKESVIKPIKKLTTETKDLVANIEAGNLFKSDIKTGDEIEELSNSFEQMGNELSEYIEENTLITAEKERIEAELDMAASIQANQLPSIFPPFPDREEFDIYASMDPAKEVGGDFYDFFFVDKDHFTILIADVSGKGIPASLFMMISKSLIKNMLQSGETPGKALEKVNNQLLEGNEDGLFVTVWMALIELSTGKCTVVNAGHEHPVVCRKGGKYELIKYRHSPAVSTFEGMKFKEHDFQLEHGDSVFVYTDGVPEAVNADLKMYGTDRLVEVLNKNIDADVKETISAVTEDIDKFVNGEEQFDDTTMLCFKYR